jgi:predicted Zn-dependent protease
MIEDRLGASEAVIEHLDRALEIKIDDARHRLLAWLFLARAYARLGDSDAAGNAVARLKKLRGGLNEWQILLQNDQSDTLRAMLESDVQTAQALVDGTLDVKTLAHG